MRRLQGMARNRRKASFRRRTFVFPLYMVQIWLGVVFSRFPKGRPAPNPKGIATKKAVRPDFAQFSRENAMCGGGMSLFGPCRTAQALQADSQADVVHPRTNWLRAQSSVFERWRGDPVFDPALDSTCWRRTREEFVTWATEVHSPATLARRQIV